MSPRPRSRLRSVVLTTLWFVPAVLVLAAGPRHVATCALDAQDNLQVGQAHNGFCEVPTDATVRSAVLLALVAGAVLVVRHRRAGRGAAGG